MSMGSEGGGPSTMTMEQDAPVKRDADAIVAARKEITISSSTGAVTLDNLDKAIMFGQNMARGETSVPKHLRGSPGACLAIIDYSLNWGFSAYAVANQSYVVGDRLAFMGQLIHAVVKKRVPLRYPFLGLESEYIGEGDERKCVVFAEVWIDAEHTATRVLKLESPIIRKIDPKNSPLWKTDPDQQLFYRTSARWQRRYFPEVLLGIYGKEELEDATPEELAELAKDVSPSKTLVTTLLERLQGPVAEAAKAAVVEGYQNGNEHVIETAKAGAPPTDEEPDDVAPYTDFVEASTEPQERPAQNGEQGAPGPDEPTGDGQAQGAEPSEPKPQRQPRKKPEPKAEVIAPPAVVEPKTPELYLIHLGGWLSKATDDAYIHDRWQSEKELRGRAMVTGDQFAAAKDLKDARLKEITG